MMAFNECAVAFSQSVMYTVTRLPQFARSLLYNATAGGALWWLRKSHIVNYAKHQHSPFARRRHDFRQAVVRRFKLHSPLSFGESFMKIRSAVPENGCLIVLVDGNKKQKKTKKNKKMQKTSAKHIRIRFLPEGGCVNYSPCVWVSAYVVKIDFVHGDYQYCQFFSVCIISVSTQQQQPEHGCR